MTGHRIRVFTGTIATETNTFSPMPTGLRSFMERGFYPAGQHPDHPTSFAGPLWAAREFAVERGWDVVEGLVAGAQPGGTVTRVAYETLRAQLLADLAAAGRVDMVLLGLHGAMVADGYDDCEGDLLRRVREIVGPDVVVGAELDPHMHLTVAMVDAADLLVAFKEYPHVDILDRARELALLCEAAMERRIRPVAALIDCHMVVPVHTTHDPGKSLVQRIRALEGHDGVLSVSLGFGFSLSDVPDMGCKVLVYTDGDAAKAEAVALAVAEDYAGLRDDLEVDYLSIDAALDRALAHAPGPVVLADRADNPGSGAPGDSTFILERMIARGIDNAVIGPMWDPVAVRLAIEAGAGARLRLRVGGKVGAVSGAPLDLDCTVLEVTDDLVATGLAATPTSMGPSVRVSVAGIEIVLVSVRNQAIDMDVFTGIGCELKSKIVIVVKSAQHFHASFSRVAKDVVYVGAPGAATPFLQNLAYTRIGRPLWPLDPIVPPTVQLIRACSLSPTADHGV